MSGPPRLREQGDPQAGEPVPLSPFHDRHFLAAYAEAAGTWIIPDAWHRWSALSLIAACVRDRVSVEILRDDPLFPNLYVMLIGPSGSGKNKAIDMAGRYSEVEMALINPYRGSITRAALVDLLARPANPVEGGPLAYGKLWLVTPELAMSVGNPAMAEDLIRFLTEVYGGAPLPLKGNTRMHGAKTVIAPCLNWLGGSTEAWLRRALPSYLVEGGFIARLIPVYAEYTGPRMARPVYSADALALADHVRARVRALATVGGQMTITAGADRLWRTWVESRPEPPDRRLTEWWSREPTLAMKLAMLMSLAESDELLITTRHVIQARELVSEVRPHVGRLLDAVAMTPEVEDTKAVEGWVSGAKVMPWSTLQRLAIRRGMDAERLERACRTAIGAGTITILVGMGQRRKVVWVEANAGVRRTPQGWRVLTPQEMGPEPPADAPADEAGR